MASEERTLKIGGMDCTGCEKRVRTALTRLEGVIKADPDHKAGLVALRYDTDRIAEEDIKERIRDAGYEA